MVKMTFDYNDIEDQKEILHLSRMFLYLAFSNIETGKGKQEYLNKALYHFKQLKQLKF